MGKKRRQAKSTGPDLRQALRWLLRILPVALLLVACAQAFHSVEQFLLEDPRFHLGTARGDNAPDIRVWGAVHASLDRIEAVFAQDVGKSIYLLPLRQRRLSLLAIDWVKDATVARIWPHRVDVFIREREPVAFMQLPSPSQASRQVALIDEEGVILKPPPKNTYDLPVISGISPQQPEPARAEGVRAALAMIADLGPHAAKVSEINVAKPDNLTVTMGIDGGAPTLILGDKNYRRRVEHFLAHYAEIRRRLPAAATFDLRLDDRITAVDGVGVGVGD